MSADLGLLSVQASVEDAAQSPVRVVLADDHALMLHTMRQLLDGEAGIEVVGQAQGLESTIEVALRMCPDVLVLAVSMPGGSRIGAIEALRGRVSPMGVVLATMERDPSFAERALASGAAGYVLKDHADAELPQAIRAVASGAGYVSPVVTGVSAPLRAAR
jgi:two-component system response regulator NreC